MEIGVSYFDLKSRRAEFGADPAAGWPPGQAARALILTRLWANTPSWVPQLDASMVYGSGL